MTRHRIHSRAAWWLVALVSTGWFGCKGCPVKVPGLTTGTEESVLKPPTVNGLPSRTKDTAVLVNGTKTAEAAVWMHQGDVDTRLVEADEYTTWEGLIPLQEGVNSLYFSCAMGRNSSDRTGPYTVTRDTAPPKAPKVDAYQAFVARVGNNPVNVTYTGTKDADSSLIMDGTEKVAVNAQTTWSIQVTFVDSGRKTIRLTSADDLGNVSPEAVINVEIATSCEPPTLDAVTSPTSTSPQRITGSKTAGTSVHVRRTPDGQDTVITTETPDTTWSHDLTLTEGNNDFYVLARQGSARSQLVPGRIVLLTPITVEEVTSPIKADKQTVTGTKGRGASVYMRTGSGTAQVVVPADDSTGWTYQVTLSNEGDNTFWFSGGAPTTSERTEEVSVTIARDTTAPEVPTMDPVDSPTTAVNVQVCGTKDEDTNVLLRQDGETSAEQVVAANSSTTFCVDVTLHGGTNEICMSSSDALGNTSTEQCITVECVGPDISFVSPVNGAVVTSDQVPVEVEAVGADGSGGEVTEVQVCLAGTCKKALAKAGVANHWESSVSLTGAVNGSTHDISASATNGNGVSSTATVRVTYRNAVTNVSDNAAPGESLGAKIALDGRGVLHVVWADDCIQFGVAACPESQAGNMPWDIFHRTYSNGTWSPVHLISNFTGGDGDSREPDITADKDGNIHVVWIESGSMLGKGSDKDVVYRTIASADGVMGAIEVLSTTTADELTPEIAASSDGNIHVVWDGLTGEGRHEVFYTRLSQGAWSTPVVVSDNDTTGQSRLPVVATTSNGCAHVVWQDDGDSGPSGTDADIFYRSVCNGVLGTVNLVSDSVLDQDSRRPTVLVDASDRVNIVWQDTTTLLQSGDDRDIWLRRYGGGSQPSDYLLVSQGSDSESFSAALALAPNGELVVAFAERQGLSATEADIRYTMTSQDYFSLLPRAVASLPGSSLNPSIVVDAAGMMHVAWVDDATIDPSDAERSPGVPDKDIFYMVVQLGN